MLYLCAAIHFCSLCTLFCRCKFFRCENLNYSFFPTVYSLLPMCVFGFDGALNFMDLTDDYSLTNYLNLDGQTTNSFGLLPCILMFKYLLVKAIFFLYYSIYTKGEENFLFLDPLHYLISNAKKISSEEKYSVELSETHMRF